MKPVMWKLLSTVAGVMAATFASRALDLTWKAATGGDPPTVPEDPDTNWREAVAWAALSGAVAGLARMLATRQAAAYYVRSTGELPKALRRD